MQNALDLVPLEDLPKVAEVLNREIALVGDGLFRQLYINACQNGQYYWQRILDIEDLEDFDGENSKSIFSKGSIYPLHDSLDHLPLSVLIDSWTNHPLRQKYQSVSFSEENRGALNIGRRYVNIISGIRLEKLSDENKELIEKARNWFKQLKDPKEANAFFKAIGQGRIPDKALDIQVSTPEEAYELSGIVTRGYGCNIAVCPDLVQKEGVFDFRDLIGKAASRACVQLSIDEEETNSENLRHRYHTEEGGDIYLNILVDPLGDHPKVPSNIYRRVQPGREREKERRLDNLFWGKIRTILEGR